jgi:hypothetical protein
VKAWPVAGIMYCFNGFDNLERAPLNQKLAVSGMSIAQQKYLILNAQATDLKNNTFNLKIQPVLA